MKSFKKYIKQDVYSLYSMNIPADLSEKQLEPYFDELMNVLIIESRKKNIVVKVKENDLSDDYW